LLTISASIVTPAPFLAKRRPLLFETAYKEGRERLATGMDID
jgi:DNA-directed RNA polymerase III subunit RPC1